ncbi:MAG: hypothetical protein IJS60_03450 [Abditibacteriota bacterium]|nr:hypothetical protein [Abditibacteriota bacterium]
MKIEIPFYNLINILFVGVSFSFINIMMYPKIMNYMKILNYNKSLIIWIIFISLTYFIGVIINRFGSLIEDFLKKFKLINFDNDYKKYQIVFKKYPNMSTLSREYALSRTGVAMFLVLFVETLIKIILFKTIMYFYLSLLFLVILFVFIFSMRKYSNKIYVLMQ